MLETEATEEHPENIVVDDDNTYKLMRNDTKSCNQLLVVNRVLKYSLF